MTRYFIYFLGAIVSWRMSQTGISLDLLLIVGCCLIIGNLYDQHKRTILKDRIHYLEERSGAVGDLGNPSMEREVKKLRRRIAGLLASPETYRRARRLVVPLDVTPKELTGELERLEYQDEDKMDWVAPIAR